MIRPEPPVRGPEGELALARWQVEHCKGMAAHYEGLAQRYHDDPDFALECVVRMSGAGDDEAYPTFGCTADEYIARLGEARRHVARLSMAVLVDRRGRLMLRQARRRRQHGRRGRVRSARRRTRRVVPARPDDDPEPPAAAGAAA